MAQFEKHFVQDLTQDLKIRQCGTIVFNKDNLSNVITIDLYNGQEPYSGGGMVAGACICPDGSTVPLIGSLSGNTASVILTGGCFAFTGQIGIGVQVVVAGEGSTEEEIELNTIKTTILKALYNVELYETDNVVDPGGRITLSVGELVNRIDRATAEIPASDMASLMSGIAPTFSASTNYASGAYVYYNGTLYRFTTAHAAGSWTGTDATAVALGNDLGGQISDLKSHFNEALNPAEGLNNLCTGVQKSYYWVAWNDGDTVTLTSNGSYMAATVDVSGLSYVSLNWMWDSNSFSFFADSDNKRIAIVKDCLYNSTNYVYAVPENAVYMYLSQNISTEPAATYIDTIGVVVLGTSAAISTSYTITDYPYGGTAQYEYFADDLEMASVSGKKLSSIIPQLVSDASKAILSTSTIYNKSGLSDFNNAPDNSLITVLIPVTTDPADLPAHYPASRVIKGIGQLVTYISSDGAIKIQTYRNAVQGLAYTRQYTVGMGWQAWYQENVKKRYTCLKNGTGDFSNLATAIQTVCEEMDAELFVGPGTWDIISDLGSDYMEAVSSTSTTWGLVLKNRIHIICSSNSVITAKYPHDGTNQANVKQYFSAFNAGENGFTLENANIETDWVRYTIHDDRGAGGGEGYVNRYINCSMKHTNGGYGDCIGGGIGTNGFIEIKDCYFEGDENVDRLAYYHGNNYHTQTDAQCKIIVNGNYFAGIGTFKLTNYGDSTKTTYAYVSNNSFGSSPAVTNGSYPDPIIQNMELVAWNNVVRE